jgi:hypothetical protein
LSPSTQRDPLIQRLTFASIGGSLALSVALVVVHVVFDSQLALANRQQRGGSSRTNCSCVGHRRDRS